MLSVWKASSAAFLGQGTLISEGFQLVSPPLAGQKENIGGDFLVFNSMD